MKEIDDAETDIRNYATTLVKLKPYHFSQPILMYRLARVEYNLEREIATIKNHVHKSDNKSPKIKDDLKKLVYHLSNVIALRSTIDEDCIIGKKRLEIDFEYLIQLNYFKEMQQCFT
jgi:hypothetical protein